MRRIELEISQQWSLETEIYYKNFKKGESSRAKIIIMDRCVMEDGKQL